MTKLSVIIPVYNAEKYLTKCLESVLNQSLKDIEVICVDDGSTDASLEILKDFEARDKRIKVLKQKNGHAGVARNNGLSAATGEYVHFLDADDYVFDYTYERLYCKAHEDKLDCIKCRTVSYDMQRQTLVENSLYMFNYLKPENFNTFLRNDIDGPIYHISVVPWNGIYRREFLEEYHIRFNSLFCVNDRSFFWRVVTNAERFMISRDWLVVHRVGQEESLVGKRAEHFDCQFKSLQTTSDQLTEDKINPEIRELIMKREISDLSNWFKRFRDDPTYGEAIRRDTKQFVEGYTGNCKQMLLDAYQERMLNEEESIRNVPEPKACTLFRKQNEDPKVSIIIPVYNAEKYLPECLDSIMCQTMENIEIICVDDGSTDSSGIILEEYAAIDKRIRVIKQKNLFAGVARNRGIKEAKGDYLLFLDADDLFDKKLCEKVYKKAAETNADIIMYGATKFDTKTGKKEKTQFLRYDLIPDKEIFSRADVDGDVLILTTPNPWLRMVRREFVLKEEIYFQEYPHSNDIYFSLVTMAVAEKITCVKEDLVNYRIGQSSNLQTTKEKQPTMFLNAYEAIYDELTRRGIYPEVEKGFVNRMIFSCNHNLSTVKEEASWHEIYDRLWNDTFKRINLLDHPEEYYDFPNEVYKLRSSVKTNEWLGEFEKKRENLQNLALLFAEEKENDNFYANQFLLNVSKEGTGYKSIYYIYEMFYCYLQMQEYYNKNAEHIIDDAEERLVKIHDIITSSYAFLTFQEQLEERLLPADKREPLSKQVIEPYKNNKRIERLMKENRDLKVQIRKTDSENNYIKNSKTYKVGQTLTWLPRKVKKILP